MEKQTHPTIARYREAMQQNSLSKPVKEVSLIWLKELVLDNGADDVGLISTDSARLAGEMQDIRDIFPAAKSLISIVCRLNRENIRCPNRAVSDVEFLQAFDRVNEVSRQVSRALESEGFRALYPAAGFPMDMSQWPGKMWPLSHKTIAVSAGLGAMGLHRLVIHPKFGSFISLGTVLTDVVVDSYDQELDYNPCVDCKLCVSVCPVGAISSDGTFNFVNCMTHNYRDRAGGFQSWAENVVSSKSVRKYREKVSDKETVSMWQSLSYGICNKSSYCMAACPAGEEVIGPFIEDRKKYIQEHVKKYQDKKEMVFVVKGSDAEMHVNKRFPHKQIKTVFNGLRPDTIANFFKSMPIVFQPRQSEGINAVYHFQFSGSEKYSGTVVIKNKKLTVMEGFQDSPDITIIADSQTWLNFLAKEKNILVALLQRKIKIKGSPRLMQSFAKCFPS